MIEGTPASAGGPGLSPDPSCSSHSAQEGFLYSQGALKDLGTLGGNTSEANAILGQADHLTYRRLAGPPEATTTEGPPRAGS